MWWKRLQVHQNAAVSGVLPASLSLRLIIYHLSSVLICLLLIFQLSLSCVYLIEIPLFRIVLLSLIRIS